MTCRKRRHATIGLTILAAILSGCVGGRPDPGVAVAAAIESLSTNFVRMLGAMPDDAESVMLVDRAKLTSQGAPAAMFVDALVLGAPPGRVSSNPPTTRQRVGRAIGMAGVTHFALAGSQFQFPEDIGVGAFNERWIAVVSGSMAGLRAELEALAAEAAVRASDHVGLRVYETVIESIGEAGYRGPAKPFFVAVFDEHTAIAAESRPELISMASGLSATPSLISPKWAAPASGLRPGTSLAVLRVYDPTSVDRLSPVNPERRYADVQSLAVSVLEDGLSLSLNVRTTERAKAIRFYEMMLPPESLLWSHRAGGKSGFSAHVSAQRSMDARFSLAMSVLMLFGINFVI